MTPVSPVVERFMRRELPGVFLVWGTIQGPKGPLDANVLWFHSENLALEFAERKGLTQFAMKDVKLRYAAMLNKNLALSALDNQKEA